MRQGGRDFAVRLSLYYGAIFGNLGLYLPFMPVWLAWRGMTPFEIGVITSAPLFVRVIATPLIGIWSDRSRDHRRTVIIAGWVGLVTALILWRAADFWSILVLVTLFQVATQSILPIVETKALSGARRLQLSYGRMRLWGSAAFIAANIGGGAVIAAHGGASVMLMVVGTVGATAVAAHLLPGPFVAEQSTGAAKATIIGAASESRSERPLDFAALIQPMRDLIRLRWFVAIVFSAGLIQGSHAVYYAFGAIHWRELGISDTWIGTLWAIGVAAEIVLFAVARPVIDRLGAGGLLVLGGVGATARWIVMAFDPPFGLLIVLQCLHALSFGATYLGTLTLIQSRVAEVNAGGAQSLHSALTAGVLMGGITLASGALYEAIGGQSLLIMAVIAAIGTGVAFFVSDRLHDER